ncbi:YfaP family protein [Candidatus Methylobacter oryzae]|uniref:DUF2135 domain-containing protein n=1 Tax=Candidatus Methylobacter oryzae TaxID=2497749 RepID=A0ABY3CEJ7_9GAMM|nr:DUF2135 domain-containing protein [Candidatus Methylobacter oryzae]TRX01283.1 DUF2135 domain-containing protein [Candidatus Methylobacter oryzae]
MNYRIVCFGLCTVLAMPPAVAESAVSIDVPKGGWNAPGDKKNSFTQQVTYPAASVNTPPGQAETALIRGRIAAHAKSGGQPATLVVNGVAMPLRIEQDGSFERPYSFSPGSNSVEVRDPDSLDVSRVQFLHNGKEQAAAGLRVVLSWDSDNTDLDLHVIAPDGGHGWYGNRVLENGGALDVDVTTGYGPEIFAMPAPLKGRYLVYVNYYGGGYSDDDPAQELTTARVTVITQEGTVNEKQESITVPLREPGELTLIRSFVYP